MQLRQHPKGGFAVWMTNKEMEQVYDYHSEDMEYQLACEYMGKCGLRGRDLENVKRQNIIQLDTEEEAYILRVEESKRGYRETPLPVDLKNRTVALIQAMGLKQNESVFDKAVRSYQRAVERAVEHLAEETETPDWEKVSAHDLRRSWATRCYYKLGGTERDLRAVMSWGGWEKQDTFANHYLGVIPEDLLVEMMNEAGLR